MSTSPTRDLPDPTSVDKPTSIQTLPYEILARIFYYLRDDRYTLAQCMRLWSGANDAVGPYLYSPTFHINMGLKSPLKSSTVTLHNRLSSTKSTNLKRIKHVDVRIPLAPGVKDPLSPDSTGFPQVDTVRIDRQPHIDLEAVAMMLSKFKPKKAVLRHTSEIYQLPSPESWKLESIVNVMMHGWCMYHPRDAETISPDPVDRQHRPSRAVYILWTSGPSVKFRCQTYGGRRPPTFYCCLDINHSWWPIDDCCLANILHLVAHQNHPSEVIIVNSGQIDYHNLEVSADLDGADIQRKFEATFLHRMVEMKNHDGSLVWPLPFGPINGRESGPLRTLEEFNEMTFKFISLPEYLATYDWTGEFTEEEVRPWLESRT